MSGLTFWGHPDIDRGNEFPGRWFADIDPLRRDALSTLQCEFGARKRAPSEQESLDWLAGRGIHDGSFDAHRHAGNRGGVSLSRVIDAYPQISGVGHG